MIYLSKQQALDAISKVIQQIDLTGNIERDKGATVFFITEEAKETILDFYQGNGKVFWMLLYHVAYLAKLFDRSTCSTILFVLILYYNKITQYNILNVKFSNLQFNKLKLGIKNGTD